MRRMNTSGKMPTNKCGRSNVGRTLSFALIAFTLAAAIPATAMAQDSKNDAIKITTTIESRIYTWRVTNISAKPITRFEIPVYRVYEHHVPEGWDIQESLERFGSAADSLEHAIAPGETKVFACRAASMTSIASEATAIIGFGDAESVEMPGLWTPSREQWSTWLIPPVVIILLAIAYAIRSRAKSRRKAATPS